MATGDIKLAYGTAADVTITIASLAPSSTLLVGQESTAVDNTTDKMLDYLVSGWIKTNATITAGGRIEIWCVGSVDGTNWPDVFEGTNSAETITNANIKNNICRLVASMQVDATGTYPFGPVSIASLFGSVPPKFVFFLTHSTHASNALDSTAGNHSFRVQPVYETIAA